MSRAQRAIATLSSAEWEQASQEMRPGLTSRMGRRCSGTV